MNGEEEPMTFMKLPSDLILNCLARVSRMHYHTLSLVSKRFHSLLSSPELYQIRTFLGCTENCLYVCLKRPTGRSPERWFILCMEPNSSKKVLVRITSPNQSCNIFHPDIASVGSNIYSIGRSRSEDDASSLVMVLDCYSNTWREAPSMLVARHLPSACVFDEKIYVTGGCKNLDASNWMEVFDTKTQTWEFLLAGNREKVCSSSSDSYQSIGYEGSIHVQCLKTNVVHKLHEGSWIKAEDLTLKNGGWRWSSSACVIGNVLYTCTNQQGRIIWYDSEVNRWKPLKGLGRVFDSGRYSPAKLADYDGKLAICWEELVFVNGGRRCIERKIWCGVIMIEKRQGSREIWGRFEWSDNVFTTIELFDVAHVVAVTL